MSTLALSTLALAASGCDSLARMNQTSLPSMARGVALINIVLGTLNLFFLPCSGLMFLDTFSKNPMVQAIRSEPVLLGWVLGSMAFEVVLKVVQIAASAALLKGQAWSRLVLLGQASFQILFVLLGVAVQGLVIAPKVLQLVEQTGMNPEKSGMLGGLLGGSIGSLFGLALPILTIVTITRPETIAALRASETPSVGPYPPSL